MSWKSEQVRVLLLVIVDAHARLRAFPIIHVVELVLKSHTKRVLGGFIWVSGTVSQLDLPAKKFAYFGSCLVNIIRLTRL